MPRVKRPRPAASETPASVLDEVAHHAAGLDAEQQALEPGVPDLEGLGLRLQAVDEAVADRRLNDRPFPR